jgi:hypothetical protein
MELSSRLKVKPLKEGEVKLFRLVGTGKIDPMSGKPSVNSGATYKGHFTIYDRFESEESKRKKVLKNVIGTETRIDDKGKEYVREIIGDLEFNSNGVIIVKHEDYNLLQLLTRANENKSNKYRNPSKPALWEEVDPTPSDLKLIDKMDIEFEAESFAKTGDITLVTQVLGKIDPSMRNLKNPGDIRFALRKIARTNPKEVIRHGRDKELKIKILISEAIQYGILDYLDESREWHYCDSVKDSLIHQSEIGKDLETDFVEFLKKNSQVTKKLTEQLNSVLHETMEV